MTRERPIGIDLFAGAGGLSLGFEQAGFDVVAAVEIDPIHAAVHKFNFPDCAVLPQSVIGLTGKEIRQAANIQNRRIDVVFGGAPCQGFSLIGQRALDDPRNALVREFVRLVAELDASYFVFENVKGLTTGRHRQFLVELIEAFAAVGYCVQLPWQVLNAYSYGVPQHRERLFIIGGKQGCSSPSYPIPLTTAAGKVKGNLPPCPSCQDALGDLPEAEDYDELLEGDSVETDAWGKPSAYARRLRCLDEDSWDNIAWLTSPPAPLHPPQSPLQGGKIRKNFYCREGSKIPPFPQEEGSNIPPFPQEEGSNIPPFPQEEGINIAPFPFREGGLGGLGYPSSIDSWGYGYQRRWEARLLTASTRTEHTKISRRRFANTKPGTVEPISRFFKLPEDGVSNTLRAGTDSARGAFTSPRPIHYEKARCITVREMARLQGFPDWFRFHETKWHGARQIGNSVPPPLARAVAEQIVKVLGVSPEKPETIINLGDTALLGMNMSQAADFWGIPVPIEQRNRKSDAKKRKQH